MSFKPFLFSFIFLLSHSIAMAQSFKTITYSTSDGGLIEADLFKTKKDVAVIFAHGAIFNKESWHFLAQKLQKENITALSINFRGYGKSKADNTNNRFLDILGAIQYLKANGYKTVNIIGGSMGGAAVIRALNTKYDTLVSKVILLAPAGGKALRQTTLSKLFIVAKNDGLYKRTQLLYANSSFPKKITIKPGGKHAQHMFKANYAADLIAEIITFIKL